MGEETTSNNRVTTREFYEAQIETQKQITEMERRIMEKLEPFSKYFNQVDTNKEEIKNLRSRSNIIDGVNAVIAIVAATIAAAIGKAP